MKQNKIVCLHFRLKTREPVLPTHNFIELSYRKRNNLNSCYKKYNQIITKKKLLKTNSISSFVMFLKRVRLGLWLEVSTILVLTETVLDSITRTILPVKHNYAASDHKKVCQLGTLFNIYCHTDAILFNNNDSGGHGL